MDYETIAFATPGAWRTWLNHNHAAVPGIWMLVYKKATGIPSINYAEALDHALCYGWIDGQRKSLDEVSYLQKYTPRRPQSLWSKRNIEHAARLQQAGLMTDSGLLEVNKAKADGRWEAAYDGPANMQLPDYFVKALLKYPDAAAFYGSLNKTNKYAIAWRLQTARTDATRQRRCEKLLAMLRAGETIH